MIFNLNWYELWCDNIHIWTEQGKIPVKIHFYSFWNLNNKNPRDNYANKNLNRINGELKTSFFFEKFKNYSLFIFYYWFSWLLLDHYINKSEQ